MRRSLIAIAIMLAAIALGCRSEKQPPPKVPPPPQHAQVPAAEADSFAEQRERMVTDTISKRGVSDPRVLAAMRATPRHELVPAELRARSYEDRPLPIGFDQTISQPYIVAAMTEAAQLAPGEKVLEVGTGSGYQAAVLAELGAEVYTIEIVEALGKRARADLERLGYRRIQFRIGDGYLGWPEAAPFDAIVVTAAPPEIPRPLIDQLAVGGRLVIPVGDDDQKLQVITRRADGTTTETLYDVRFVPMTGEAQRTRDAR